MESSNDLSHSSPSSVILEPALNTCYYIKRADDSWYMGRVIESRQVEVDNEKIKKFFIHYKDRKIFLTYF